MRIGFAVCVAILLPVHARAQTEPSRASREARSVITALSVAEQIVARQEKLHTV